MGIDTGQLLWVKNILFMEDFDQILTNLISWRFAIPKLFKFRKLNLKMRDEFQFRKKNQLGKRDKSGEQQVDEKIKKLVDRINKSKDYYTTSSCSGRIVLVKSLVDKAKNVFLFKSHDKISIQDLKKAIENINYKDLVYFKQEPVILHIACSDLQKAEELLEKAQDSGFKKKGIITTRSRIVVELIGSEKLELPIISNKRLLVNDAYLKLLIKEANERLERSWEKLCRLEKRI